MATKLGKIVADFRTTLATELAVGGTSATLQSATDADGNAIPAGTYFFTLDKEGSQKEHIVCSVSGTAVTSISTVTRQGVQASGAARKHRIGASVEITDFAHIMYMNDLLAGTTDLNAADPLKYDGTATLTPGSNELCTVAYADALTFAGAPNGSTTQKGLFEEATVAEQGTAAATGGTGARLVPSNANLVKSSSGSGDENKIAILNASGQFAAGFIADASTTVAGKSELATGAETASGTATGGSGSPLVPANSSFTATSSGSADANKVPVLTTGGVLADGFAYFTATAGETVAAGQGAYAKAADSRAWKSVGTSDEAAFNFIGVFADAGNAGDTVRIVPPGGMLTTSGLTAGAYYFVTDTAGTLGTTPGTRFARVGLALSTTRLLVLVPKYLASGSFTYQFNDASPLPAQTVGFRPALIHFFATSGSVGASVGTNFGQVMSGGTGLAVNNSSDAWYVKDGGGDASTGNAGALSSTGFTPTHSSVSTTSQATVRWVAESF